MRTAKHICTVAFTMLLLANGSMADPPTSAEEKLAACARKYAEAKAYQDDGELTSVISSSGRNITDRKPFKTSFERDARFQWEFRHARMPGGKPTDTYTVWSSDQKTFDSYWTLLKKPSTTDSIDMAMAAPTGVSGGSATAIVPLLRPDMAVGVRTTSLTEVVDKGTEKIDDHECSKIQGKNGLGRITVWLDKDLLIRKIEQITEVDPSMFPPNVKPAAPAQPFKVHTTIVMKPTMNEKIEDGRFVPPPKN